MRQVRPLWRALHQDGRRSTVFEGQHFHQAPAGRCPHAYQPRSRDSGLPTDRYSILWVVIGLEFAESSYAGGIHSEALQAQKVIKNTLSGAHEGLMECADI